MFEVWWQEGRSRKIVARFRLISDAEKFVAGWEGGGELTITGATVEGPVSSRAPASKKPPPSMKPGRSDPAPSSVPPASTSAPRRRVSGVHGRVQGAAEHPDEFIADQVDDAAGDDKSACSSSD